MTRADLDAWRRRHELRKGNRAQPIPGKKVVEDAQDDDIREGLGEWEDRG